MASSPKLVTSCGYGRSPSLPLLLRGLGQAREARHPEPATPNASLFQERTMDFVCVGGRGVNSVGPPPCSSGYAINPPPLIPPVPPPPPTGLNLLRSQLLPLIFGSLQPYSTYPGWVATWGNVRWSPWCFPGWDDSLALSWRTT